jgi:hypothetical protein
LTLDVKKSNSSNETPNVMTVGVENYGLSGAIVYTCRPRRRKLCLHANLSSPEFRCSKNGASVTKHLRLTYSIGPLNQTLLLSV